MGFLLKIAIFAVVVYGAWSAVRRWFGLFGGLSKPSEPPRAPGPQPRRVVVEDTHLCTVCGAYVAANAAKCGRSDCPQP
jgi:hypothetical protein